MRFMLMIKGNQDYEAGKPPSPELEAAIGAYTEKMMKSGVVVGVGGLYPSSHGARVRLAKGRLTVSDGPFAEAKELIGGYAIVEVESKEVAVQMAKDFLQLHRDVLGPSYEGESEVRRMHELP